MSSLLTLPPISPPSPPLPPILYAPRAQPPAPSRPPRLKIVLLLKQVYHLWRCFMPSQAAPARCFKSSSLKMLQAFCAKSLPFYIASQGCHPRTASISCSPTRQLRCLNTINGPDWTFPSLTMYPCSISDHKPQLLVSSEQHCINSKSEMVVS
jgi:hypothetical protein